MRTTKPSHAAPPPRVLLMTVRPFPTIQEAVMRMGAARGWRMRFGYVPLNPLPPVEDYEGILFIGGTPEIRAWAAKATCPVVRIFDGLEQDPFPVVDTDDRLSGRMGARHFLELGYHNLVFMHVMDMPGTLLRRDGFIAEAAGAGRKASVLKIPTTAEPGSIARSSPAGSRNNREEWLARKLSHLPKPMAILPEDDSHAPEIVQAALLAGLRVPQDVAVLGADNLFPDHLAASPVPLSTIKANPSEAAVTLLADLMAGRPAPDQPILIPPLGITIRTSTAFFVSEVPGITDAVLYLRTHFRERILVDHLAQHVHVSLRKLQSEVKQALGHTISDELFRLRVEHAQRLLRETDMKVAAVAVESGFGDHAALHRAFKQVHDLSPGKYREHAWKTRPMGT